MSDKLKLIEIRKSIVLILKVEHNFSHFVLFNFRNWIPIISNTCENQFLK